MSSSTQIRITKGIGITFLSLFMNVLLAVIKIFSGILGHSYALIADGIESTVDIFSSTIVWGGLKISAIPSDKNHPYGHGKAESLAAMLVSLLLFGAALWIAVQSLQGIRSAHEVPAPFTLGVLAGVILIKEGLFRWLFKMGESVGSLSIQVDAWHHRSDAWTSIAAFIGITIARIGGPNYASADDWAALFACGIIFFNGIRLFNLSIGEIMDAAPSPKIEADVRSAAQKVAGVWKIEKCRIRKSGLGYFVEIHVEVDGQISVRQGHNIAHNVKDALIGSNLGILDVLVHIEPNQ